MVSGMRIVWQSSQYHTYVGDEIDGCDIKLGVGPDGWYFAIIVDSNSGYFVEGFRAVEGPYPTPEIARGIAIGIAKDWCLENNVDCSDGWGIFNDLFEIDGKRWYQIERDDHRNEYESDIEVARLHFRQVTYVHTSTDNTADNPPPDEAGWRVIARDPATAEAKAHVASADKVIATELEN